MGAKLPFDKEISAVNFKQSRILQRKSHALIPGGSHTYAKGDDQFPELSPGFIMRGEGCHVWDVDGNEFIEYGMGLRAVTLGHAFKPVVEAVYKHVLLGSNFTRPAAVEIECAETLLSLIKGADMVKFTKDGSTATTAAIKLARAYTGRNVVAICAQQPFFSYDDWFIGTTTMSAGIPQAIRELTVKFDYNDVESVKRLFEHHPGEIACVILEASRTDEPKHDFLLELQRLCIQNGALLILDEMITGFRWDIGGAQKYYGITPDLSTFGKALANGFAVSALLGKREIMDLGGIYRERNRVFLLSTTHGAETHALAAAIATMHVYQEEPVIEHLHRQGQRLIDSINKAIEEHDLSGYFRIGGRSCNLVYTTLDSNHKESQLFRTLFLQETIKRGIIMPSLVVSYAHTDIDIERTIEVIGEVLYVYRKAIDQGIEKYLVGRPVKPVFYLA